MPVCPNCGTPVTSHTGKIVAWCLGIFMVVGFGLPLVLIFALAAIAAIGSYADPPSHLAELDAAHQPPAMVVESIDEE